MKNISYKFTIPSDLYETFKGDVGEVTQKVEFAKSIEFDDAAQTVLFNCDSRALWLLFEENLERAKAEKYGFICCAPTDYKNCQRFEDGREVTFQQALDAEMIRYAELAPTLKNKSLGKETEGEIDPTASVVISEYHPDPHPKEKLQELLPGFDRNTVLVLERLPASQNDAVEGWLKDGDPNSELPTALKLYCDRVDKSNLDQVPPASSEEYHARISSATKDTLFAAKKGGVDVRFLETEHTDFDNNRHKHLVVALSDLKAENPGKKFVLLCGIDHENPRINEVTFSDAIGAASCRIVDDAIIGPEFHRRGKICEVDSKQKDAEKWFSYAAESGYIPPSTHEESKEHGNNSVVEAILDPEKGVQKEITKIPPKTHSSTKPLYIFIGEQHDDFSNVSLVSKMLESCASRGLKAAFYSEDDSQLEKMGRFTYPDGRCGADNLPDNWKYIAAAVDNNPAHNKEVRLLGSGREYTVFDPFLEKIAEVSSNKGNFTGAKKAFSEVMKKITDPTVIGINPAFRPSIDERVKTIQDEGRGPDITKPENFGHYVQNFDPKHGINLLLSSAIADRMAGEIKKHQTDEDVVIVLTGNNHTENVADRLGVPRNEMVMISNCKNEFAKDGYLKGVDVMPFEVDGQTKMPIIPPSIEEKLTKALHEKNMGELDKEPGIGGHQHADQSEEIQESWVSKVSGKRPEAPTRGI